MYITKASWEINRNCNADCIHCYVEGSNKSETLREEECKIIIDKLYQGGVEELSITGGEPILSKNFKYIAQYAIYKGIGVSVITNGFSLKEDDVNFLNVHKIFPSLSFHAGTIPSFECIYRVSGRFFLKFLDNLEALTQYSLSTSLMEENRNDLDKMIQIVDQHKQKVTRWSVYNLRQSKRGHHLAKDVAHEEKEKIRKYLEYRCEEFEIPITVALEDKRKEDCPLVYGQTSLFIDPIGRVRPCYALVDFVSDKNLVNHSLEEVVNADIITRWKSPALKFDNRCKAELLEKGYSLDYVTQAGGVEPFLDSIIQFKIIRTKDFGENNCRLYNPETKESFMIESERKDILEFDGKTVRGYVNHLKARGYEMTELSLERLYEFIRSLEESSMLMLIPREEIQHGKIPKRTASLRVVG